VRGVYNLNMKTCNKCNIEKPFNKFDKTPAGNLRNTCESCRWEYKKSLPSYIDKKNKVRLGNKNRQYNLKKSYDMSLEEYDQILKKQNNKCAICEKENSHKNKFLFVDHDHESNQVRGLLCHACNILIGNAKDSPQVLERAIAYLKLFS